MQIERHRSARVAKEGYKFIGRLVFLFGATKLVAVKGSLRTKRMAMMTLLIVPHLFLGLDTPVRRDLSSALVTKSMKHKAWSEEENARLKELVAQGVSIARAAAIFSRKIDGVRLQARKLGVSFPVPKKRAVRP